MSSKTITTNKRLIHNTVFNVYMRLGSAVDTFLMIRFFLCSLGEERWSMASCCMYFYVTNQDERQTLKLNIQKFVSWRRQTNIEV